MSVAIYDDERHLEFTDCKTLTLDWDDGISAAEDDLKQVGKPRKGNEKSPSSNDIKSIIERQIKSLT